jgi:hypothetical protein
MVLPQGVHLVGSVNYPDAATTFRTASSVLGGRLRRVPDGEVGERFSWVSFQSSRLGSAEGIERVGDDPVLIQGFDVRPVRIADGVDPASVVLPPLGYAAAALESWSAFERMRSNGEIPAGVRFQVALPTPAAVVNSFVIARDRARFEPVYRDALYRELQQVLDAIPHESLSIQWDTAVEFGFIENAANSAVGFAPWFDDVWPEVIARALDQVSRVPADVEVGFHLCYGDRGEKHFLEPADAGNLARFAQTIVDRSPRPISWIHLPVPIERDDDDYFAPLDTLALPESTELYLGLVHREDGAGGASRRIATALRHVDRFGVATECGCGRAPESETENLIRIHAEVAVPW